MKKLSTFFSVVIQSFYSKRLYRDVALKWTMKQVLLFLLLCAAISQAINFFLAVLHSSNYLLASITVAVMMTVIMSLYIYILLIVASLIFSSIGTFIGKYCKVHLSFQQFFKVALLAFVPSIVLKIIFTIITLYYLKLDLSLVKNIFNIFFYFFYLIAFAYFIYGNCNMAIDKAGPRLRK